jgi:hypothetical protein
MLLCLCARLLPRATIAPPSIVASEILAPNIGGEMDLDMAAMKDWLIRDWLIKD